MIGTVDPTSFLQSVTSFYYSAFLILGGLSLGGLSIGLLWVRCGSRIARRMREKIGRSGRIMAVWNRLDRGAWG